MIAMLLFAVALAFYAVIFLVQQVRELSTDLAERDGECDELKLELGRLLQAEKERIAPSRRTPFADLVRAFDGVAASFESLR